MQSDSKNSRQIQAENTKRKIFDSAMRLLEQHDFSEITIREIVKEAEVSTGTFYHYYTTKLDVYYATYEIADHYFDSTVRNTLPDGSSLDKIRAFFSEYARYHAVITPLKLTKILYNSDNTRFHRKGSIMFSLLSELCNKAIESEEFSTGFTGEEIAAHLMISIRGVIYDWCLDEGKEDLDSKIRYHLCLLLPAFTGKSPETMLKNF